MAGLSASTDTGAVHLAVGRRGVRHGRGQRGEFAATNLQGDSLLDYL